MIELNNVTTGFHSYPVSSNIDFTINDDALISVIGPNGCGKTTLLKTIAGLLHPLKGSININGISLYELSKRSLARQVSFLPQVRSVPDINVETLVSHGRFPHLKFSRQMTVYDKECVERAMELTNITNLRRRNLSTLSGGERQKVYIAMTVAQGTPVVIWDEPTTFLDISCQFDILELAGKLNQNGIAIVMAIHDLPSALSYSKSICIMDTNKRIVMHDTAKAVYSSGIIDRIYNISSSVHEHAGKTHYFFFK